MNSKSIIKLFVIILAITLIGCSSTKKTSSVSETSDGTESQTRNVATTDSSVNNPATSETQERRYGETPEDSILCIRNLSLYSEHYRQSSFDLAYVPWQEAMEICPKASQNLYIHGARLLKDRYNKVPSERRDEIIDSLMWMYDMRIEHFGREGFVLGRKGVDLYLYSPERAQQIFDITEKSIDMEGYETQPDVIVINLQTGITLAQAGLKASVNVYKLYERAYNIIEYNLENNPDRANVYERILGQVESLCRPYTTCEVLVQVFTPRFQENPNDKQLLEQITEKLDESNCTTEELFYKSTRNLHKIEPTATSAFLMGRLETNLENYNKVIEYYTQAAELYGEKSNLDEQYRTYMLKAELLYRQMGRYSLSRRSALKAAEAQPENGRPYILIGEMYASTAEDCGADDFTKRVAYWAAVDKFRQARDIDNDPDIKNRAQELIDAYSRYFPDRETIFFHGYEEGDTFRVECWINETTRVISR